MNKDLKKVFESSSLEVVPGKFVYVKVAKAPNIDGHFLVAKDESTTGLRHVVSSSSRLRHVRLSSEPTSSMI